MQTEYFINRELSWLSFNQRVLEEAQNPENPLLERAKFLSIFSSNLDEFFMIRVAGLREQAFGDEAPQDFAPDGLRPIQQLEAISARTRELVEAQLACWRDQIQPALANEGIQVVGPDDLTAAEEEEVEQFFESRAFPILTPMAVDPSHPRPLFHNRNVYLGALLERRRGLGPRQLFAVVQMPLALPRLVPLQSGSPELRRFVPIEQIVAQRLPRLFGGFRVVSHAGYRITRDNDIELMEQESDDMLSFIEKRLRARQRTDAVRLEIAAGADPEIAQRLVAAEALHGPNEKHNEVYEIDGLLDLTCLSELAQLSGFDHLSSPPFTPSPPRGVAWGRGEAVFRAISRGDVLLHHPYDSFEPVTDFIRAAAEDPKVLAIKQTLYRAGGGDSPIIRALVDAAHNGKEVTALVELKARFDEAANVSWARQLERAGVHVVFGFIDLKTHCKLALVVRQEGDDLVRYVHLGTGNYNASTARLYTDLGLFTRDEDIGEDASALFNLLTGYSQGHDWKQIVTSPESLHRRTLELIHEQTDCARRGEDGYIFAKCNSLVDHQIIEALYEASSAGVQIDLVIRGICCLRPGVPGVSENIHVRSIVDRFLEHSRIFIFSRGEEAQVFLSSADWMPRNFFRRVESMFPIESPELRDRILTEIVPAYLRDNSRARILGSDGVYRMAESSGLAPIRAQLTLLTGEPPPPIESPSVASSPTPADAP